MKKTLIITFEFPPLVGGVSSSIEQIAGMLPSEQVVVLAPHHPNETAFDATAPYAIVRRTMLFPRIIWPRWIRLFFQVQTIVRKERIQMMMAHHCLPVGVVAFLVKKICRVPYLLFFHGTDLARSSRSPWTRFLVRIVAKEANEIFFSSEWLRNRFVQVYPEEQKKTVVLSPCPDARFFETPDAEIVSDLRERYALDGKKVILSVGHLVEGKGFRHFLRLLPDIVKEVPNAVWIIVGDGPKRGDLSAMTQKLHLQNSVRFLGEVERFLLPAHYALVDVFALLTHPHDGEEEALGLVFLEAAASRVPVIAGIAGGVPEAVIDQKTGILVNAYRDREVVSEIVRILREPAYGQQLGANGKEYVAHAYRPSDRIAVLLRFL